MTTMKIQIKRRLSPVIYKSQGGGETRLRHQLAAGPRNLLRAIALLRDERRTTEAGYGCVGAGRTWLEIDGREIDDIDLSIIEQEDPDLSRTERARRFIAAVRRGSTHGWAG